MFFSVRHNIIYKIIIHLKIVSVSIIVNKFSTSFIYSGLERIKQINMSFQNKHVDKSVVSLN